VAGLVNLSVGPTVNKSDSWLVYDQRVGLKCQLVSQYISLRNYFQVEVFWVVTSCSDVVEHYMASQPRRTQLEFLTIW